MRSFKEFITEGIDGWIHPSGKFLPNKHGEIHADAAGRHLANDNPKLDDPQGLAFKRGYVRVVNTNSSTGLNYSGASDKAAINASNHLEQQGKGKTVHVDIWKKNGKLESNTFRPHEHQAAHQFMLDTK